MNIKIEETDNSIRATVTVPFIDKTKGERILVTLKDVKKELKERNIKIGTCVKGRHNTLWNTNKDNLTSVWVFKKSSELLKEKITQLKGVSVEHIEHNEPEVLVKPEAVKRKRTSSRRSKKSYSKTGLVE